jgi:hypothetical protein
MRLSSTSVGTKRPLLGLLLLAELILAAALLGVSPVPAPAGPPAGLPAALTTASAPPSAPETLTLRDGRTVHLIGLGGAGTAPLLARIAAQMDDAASAVTMFWGSDWPREILIVAAESDAQFGSLAGGGADVAATTTNERIMFAPGAAGMSEGALRIVVRHELFHYASRADTAADAPRWLTEGVADFVGRPATPRPENAAELAQLPTDADLSGPQASAAYDRAWWFSRFVADEYGPSRLRALYLRACAPGHPDAGTAVRDTLGADFDTVLARWRQWLTG